VLHADSLSRLATAALALGLLAGSLALPPVPEAVAGPIASAAPKTDWMKPGTRLVAIHAVQLREALLRKGTKVRIVEIDEQDGRVQSLSLELPDGHVIHQVAVSVARRNFQPTATKVPSKAPKRK
jgi:hypothetical protein